MSYIADNLNLSAQVFNVIATCSSSMYAFYNAALISQDMQTPVVVFAGDNRTDDYSLWHFNSFGALDQTTGRPFDKSSKGFKMGKGMSLYIVKHPSVKSKLDPKAVIQDFYFFTQPSLVANPGSAEDLIKHFDRIDYKKIDLWNAHATGTPVGDVVEYEYFSKTCKHDIPIVGFKSYIGHCMAASGAIEIAMTLDCKQSNILKPNIIIGDKLVNDDRIVTQPTSFSYKRMLKTSLGFGGKTAVSVIDLL
jgi:3-oxoacyl-[acyl-carrier-protein] synthase II